MRRPLCVLPPALHVSTDAACGDCSTGPVFTCQCPHHQMCCVLPMRQPVCSAVDCHSHCLGEGGCWGRKQARGSEHGIPLGACPGRSGAGSRTCTSRISGLGGASSIQRWGREALHAAAFHPCGTDSVSASGGDGAGVLRLLQCITATVVCSLQVKQQGAVDQQPVPPSHTACCLYKVLVVTVSPWSLPLLLLLVLQACR